MGSCNSGALIDLKAIYNLGFWYLGLDGIKLGVDRWFVLGLGHEKGTVGE